MADLNKDLASAPNPYGSTYGDNGGALPTTDDPNDPSNFNAEDLKTKAGPTESAITYKPDDSAMVSSQLTKLLAGDSPYVAVARNKAAEYANSRGLMNTSFGAGMGERAAIESALPIATSDATTNASAQAANALQENAFALDTNRFGRQGALAAQEAGYASGREREQIKATAAESAATRAADAAKAVADNDIKAKQIAINEADQTLRAKQADIDAKTTNAKLLGDLQTRYLDARTQLETTPNLDQDAKARAISAMSEWYTSQVLRAIQGSISSPDDWPDFTVPASTAAPAAPAAAPAAPPAVSPSPDTSDYHS